VRRGTSWATGNQGRRKTASVWTFSGRRNAAKTPESSSTHIGITTDLVNRLTPE